ncbi:MAG: phosphate/phosphite/phosphonate ABC transporter substrate-binding protein [Campylobacterales bacterium]|nr:phosphate/phosphite/phosphonate ABC transporter substrate-binding protein [Campylobacterales bacterium]
MCRLILIFLLFIGDDLSAQTLRFGVIATVSTAQMQERFAPLLRRLEEITGHSIELGSGYDYADTIEKFAAGEYDLGYIGPAPYIEVMRRKPGSLWIAAALDSGSSDDFRSAVVVKKGSTIASLNDLSGKRFAFGSPDSTLSYYVPMKMLMDAGVDRLLGRYDFLGRHDRVASYVIMGKYDAGALKLDVARSYGAHLQIIAVSPIQSDFLIVCSADMDPTLRATIQQTLLSLQDQKVLRAIKPSLEAFVPRSDSDYDPLRALIESVEGRAKAGSW